MALNTPPTRELARQQPGHLMWLPVFQIPSNAIDHYKHLNQDIAIQPELINMTYGYSKTPILKIVCHLKPRIITSDNRLFDRIYLGAFGQSDPVRMWKAALNMNNILNAPGYLDVKLKQVIAEYGPDSRVSIELLLQDVFNIAFSADPVKVYDEESVYSRVHWGPFPIEIRQEIIHRINHDIPLNYIYLLYFIHFAGSDNVLVSGVNEIIEQIAKAQLQTSVDHFQAMRTQDLNYGNGHVYTNLKELLSRINFSQFPRAFTELWDSKYRQAMLNIEFSHELQLYSSIPAVNITSLFMQRVINILGYELKAFESFYTEITKNKVIERFIFCIIEDAYQIFSANGVNLGNMELSRFAAEVYQLALNNQDRSMKIFLDLELARTAPSRLYEN